MIPPNKILYRINSNESSAQKKNANEEVVKAEVANFMDNASITENNLKRLEKKISSRCGQNAPAPGNSVVGNLKSTVSAAASGAAKDGKKGGGKDDGRDGEYSVVSSAAGSKVSGAGKESSLYV